MLKVNKKLNAIIALEIIITMTLYYFIFVGATAVTYALDVVKTNHTNVDFSAYFLDSNGEKVEKLEDNIDKGEEYLYVEVSVKNEGYFDGTIRLNDSNFNIKQEKLSSEIAEISGNEVKLNQINAGSTATIKLGIEAKKDDVIKESTLNTKTKVELDGQYINSKNVEKDKYVDINGTAEVEMSWKSSQNTNAELESSILTNSVYSVNGEEKRIVQLLVNSKITANNYPVKNTEIKVSVPENVEEVKVHTRSTKATNSNINFGEDNYQYDEQNKKLTIKLSNEDTNNISWGKNVQDTFIVTYVLDKEQNVANKNITVESNIKTYDNKEITANQNVLIEKEIDGILSYSTQTKEDAIYKGKIYTGEERDYTVINRVNVDYLNVVENITIQGKEATYLAGEQEGAANIVYKETKIDKQEFLKIFGQEGYITVRDSNGSVIGNITSNSETDENGKIVVSYSGRPKNIELTTSKPINLGTLNIENTKTILNAGYEREVIDRLTGIKESIAGIYNEKEMIGKETTMGLKNISSKAILNVGETTLSATDKNENVKITAVLLNNDESRDLYQNPTIKIALPKQVTGLTAKCKVLYGNGLELADAKILKENGVYVIEVALAGNQNSYNTETLEGTTIIIYANLEVDKLATNSDEEIKLNYTNEIATSLEDNGEEKTSVKIVANSGVITTNNIAEYEVETIGDQGTKTVALDVSKEEKDANIDINVVNNEGTAIRDVTVLGKFPTGENANLGAALTSGINILSSTQNAKVYYSEKENPTADLNDSLNNWSTEGDANTTKSYLVKIDNMEAGEKFEANYTIKIPANLSYNLGAEEGYMVNYTNQLTQTQKTAKATTLNLTTGTGAEVSSTLKAYVGENEIANGDTVYNGEVIRYELTVKNTGSEEAKNVNIEANVPENATCVQYTKSTNHKLEGTTYELPPTSDYFQEIETENNKLTKTIETLAINEEKTLAYEVKVKDEAINNTISSKANINYYGTANATELATNETNTIANPIAKADVKMDMVMISRPSYNLEAGFDYIYYLTVANTSNKKLSNIKVGINTNSEYTLERVIDETNQKEINCENNIFTIETLEEGEIASYLIGVMTSDHDGTATISAIANNMYRSNKISETVKATDISISMTSNNEGETVKNGDPIIYNINLKNNGSEPIDYLEIQQQISTYLDVERVTINGEEVEVAKDYSSNNNEEEQAKNETSEDTEDTNTMEESNKYKIGFSYRNSLAAGESLAIVVETSSDSEFIHSKDVHMVSIAKATVKHLTVQSEEINHILTANVNPEIINPGEEPEDPKPGEDPEDPKPGETPEDPKPGENPEDPEPGEDPEAPGTEETYTISGTAWLDANGNGQRDSQEQTLSGIKVRLLNLENNSSTTATTAENGFYSLTKVPNGKYVAIFEYDTEKYILTTYQADGVQESRNSDVENVTMNIDGTSKKVASTDTLQVNGSSITNIDIGLAEAKTFDLELSKTVTKVNVINKEGTKTLEYNDTSLAKVEVKAKYLKGTTVVIEYKIKVTNNGEVAGYAKNIVDYKPSDLSFNSSLNPEWYQSGDYLYSTSLANEKIEAGETKEIKLVLTKTMTESNTGLVNNTAEISEDYNSLGIADIDSTAGNKKASEDDMGSANVIISVSTGVAVSYIALTLSIIAIIAVGAYIVSKKILKENIKF